MKYDFDMIVIGLGPAGMAVSIMGSAMGLRVCGIEKAHVGGECMNVGCIPSKALLRMAKARHTFDRLRVMELAGTERPSVLQPFEKIRRSIAYIQEKKTIGMFEKVTMVHQEGAAAFVDPHTIEVGGKRLTAKRIFLCVGTRPEIPPFPGIDSVPVLTNENMFNLESVPARLVILGGGAIACEMAQAFRRLGSAVTIIIRAPRLMRKEDAEGAALIEKQFAEEGIAVLTGRNIRQISKQGAGVRVETDKGDTIDADRLLVAAGRKLDFSELRLDAAGVAVGKEGITVSKTLQTTQPHIYACGDCNGYRQLSHAAMHQGMIALMNSMSPWPFKQDFRKFVVPWTVFTEPQFSHVGMNEDELRERGIKYETTRVNYADYGAAIAESVDTGFLKVHASALGKIYGVTIVGEGSGEMINEWALAIQKGIRLYDIMMLQHSFPTMGFLSKRIGETWMMGLMKSPWLQKICRWMF